MIKQGLPLVRHVDSQSDTMWWYVTYREERAAHDIDRLLFLTTSGRVCRRVRRALRVMNLPLLDLSVPDEYCGKFNQRLLMPP